jgi:hypothetical protein
MEGVGGVGKALVMGWSEATVNRYEKGAFLELFCDNALRMAMTVLTFTEQFHVQLRGRTKLTAKLVRHRPTTNIRDRFYQPEVLVGPYVVRVVE